ncbi:hypothetical protein PMI18_04414 [Pseudomonas sp. GM102]|nr:hypothetical protein PMI18_04414 [Pseudomonas sp. GM102]
MSRSLGLREDQRVGEVLAARIAGLFPVDRRQAGIEDQVAAIRLRRSAALSSKLR